MDPGLAVDRYGTSAIVRNDREARACRREYQAPLCPSQVLLAPRPGARATLSATAPPCHASLRKAHSPAQRLALRQRVSTRIIGKLEKYLLELQQEVLPKSPSGAAVRYALNQWKALTRFLEDGELEIDNGATERANRDIALGRGNWTFFGSDRGGNPAAVLQSFVATCKRCGVEPFTWFRDVLSRISQHPVTRLSELLPHNWNATASPAQA